MSLESFLPKDIGIPQDVLIQECLARAVDGEQVVEVMNYDFTVGGKVAVRRFELGEEGVVNITPSPVPASSHRLTISNIPESHKGGIYVAAFPYHDSTKLYEALDGISNQEREENEELMNRRSGGFMFPPSVPFSTYGESAEAYKRRLKTYDEELDEWNRNEALLAERESLEEDEIVFKYERMRRQARAIKPEVKNTVAFFPSVLSADSTNQQTLDFHTTVSNGSLFIPFNPVPFEHFKERSFLQPFLAYLSKDRGNIGMWNTYFKNYAEKFPIQSRLAIMSKLQTLRGML